MHVDLAGPAGGTTVPRVIGCVLALGCVLAAIAATVAPAARAAGERCGAPLVGGGQPALVAIVIDGATSKEPNSGSSRPLQVPNWCPALPDGSERRMPAGIEDGYRTWAGLQTVERPPTTTCRPDGGLGSDACLVGRLADAGAIVLPYSYAGSRVDEAGEFTFNAYTAQDTLQEPATSIARLDTMITSIARAWPSTRVVIVAHSYGGVVASGWWRTRAPGGIAPVQHIFTLNSPINGVPECAIVTAAFGIPVGNELCRRWQDRDAFDRSLIARNTPVTFTPIGTIDDPTYGPLIDPVKGVQVAGGGQLRGQLLYSCPDAGSDPRSACIAAPSVVASADPQCSGAGPGILGRTGHHAVIGCPGTTRTVMAGTSPGLVVASGRAGRTRPTTMNIGGVRLTRLRWSAWDGAVARGRGLAAGRTRMVVLSRPLPCDQVRRFAYSRAKVSGRTTLRHACPAALPTVAP
ncbi:hypothetical protein DSM112329_03687 [Paraconexibacter sp. AEG42_29]|uniref:Uncharacterized protein n=1 Tax=Paraconexibacter sp. AEG42_29 TaxID=2997339 RepID=A0AAU7AYS9_9ACTN